jgi:uncharacterized protein (TIGR02266 family)
LKELGVTMAFLARDASVAGASSNPSPAAEREAELHRAEQAMRTAELQLTVEVERVAHEAAALTDRARVLEGEAGGLEEDADVQAVLLRLREPAPVPAMATSVERAFTARLQALELRRKSAEAIRTGLRACGEVLAERSRSLAQDAQTLSRVRAAAAAQAALQARATAAAAEAALRKPAAPQVEAPAAEAAAESRGAAGRPAPSAGNPIGKIALKRVAARVAMQTQVDLSSDSNFFTGFSTNISEGGLFVATVNVLPPGTPVDVTFSLPAGSRLTVKGEVRWTREVNDRTPEVFPGVGVRFTEVDPAVVSQIKSFVQQREPLFFPD